MLIAAVADHAYDVFWQQDIRRFAHNVGSWSLLVKTVVGDPTWMSRV